MEIHHHSRPGNRWTHYAWEFIMLFLAVFCGFLAENIREHTVDHKRARQFASSLLNDLQEDSSALEIAIEAGRHKIAAIDSLVEQIERPRKEWQDTLIYRYEGLSGRVRPFVNNSGTYDQMKSSGSLRYFDKTLSDLLNQYAVQASKTKAREDIQNDYAVRMLNPFILNVIDARPLIRMQDNKPPGHPLVFRKYDNETIA
ncbi:MAG TPA: hypothetical protein V6C65_27920, partial [Allocoleopsis sp.]